MSQSALQPLLRVDGLNVTFPSPHGPVESVRDLSFQVNPGEILALVGESGSGKSVTARTLVGLAGERAQIQANAIELVRHDAAGVTCKHSAIGSGNRCAAGRSASYFRMRWCRSIRCGVSGRKWRSRC